MGTTWGPGSAQSHRPGPVTPSDLAWPVPPTQGAWYLQTHPGSKWGALTTTHSWVWAPLHPAGVALPTLPELVVTGHSEARFGEALGVLTC